MICRSLFTVDRPADKKSGLLPGSDIPVLAASGDTASTPVAVVVLAGPRVEAIVGQLSDRLKLETSLVPLFQMLRVVTA